MEELFFGRHIPTVIKGLPIVRKLTAPQLAKILDAVMTHISTEDELLRARVFEELEAEMGPGASQQPDVLPLAYTTLYEIMTCAVRSNVSTADFKKDLETIKFPANLTQTLKVALEENRGYMEAVSLENRICLPSIVSLRWRVDVTISTSALTRVLKPTILLQVALSTGAMYSLELNVEQFHELRYNTALALQQMEAVHEITLVKAAASSKKRKLLSASS